MVNIDYIMELLDWNNSSEDQSLGIQLAREVKCIDAFLQPIHPYGKRVWDNCAIILSERSDEELSWHLFSLMEWLQDLNWPGALCILERLQKYKEDQTFKLAFKASLKKAQALDDDMWEYGLNELISESTENKT